MEEELLGRMDGVGRVQVMLTLKNGPELELAEDADDTDRDGELRRQREPVTLNRGQRVSGRGGDPGDVSGVSGGRGGVPGGRQRRRPAGGDGGGGGADGAACRPHHGGAMGFMTGGTDMKKKMEEAGGGGGRAAAGVRGGVHELALH